MIVHGKLRMATPSGGGGRGVAVRPILNAVHVGRRPCRAAIAATPSVYFDKNIKRFNHSVAPTRTAVGGPLVQQGGVTIHYQLSEQWTGKR